MKAVGIGGELEGVSNRENKRDMESEGCIWQMNMEKQWEKDRDGEKEGGDAGR